MNGWILLAAFLAIVAVITGNVAIVLAGLVAVGMGAT